MTSAADYVRGIPQRPSIIDKVLLLVNSDSALSGQVADYYQAARGLINHRLTLTGAQLAAIATNGQLAVVNNYINDNNIRAVIATPGCPNTVLFNGMQATTEALCADSNRIITTNSSFLTPWQYFPFINTSSGGQYRPPSGYTMYADPDNDFKTPDGNGYYVAYQADTDYLVNRRPKQQGSAYAMGGQYFVNLFSSITVMPAILWGRLGFPQFGGMVAETFAETKRMIDDCIWAEQQDILTKSLALGFGDYTAQGMHQLQWYAWQFAKAKGLQTNYWTCDAAGTGQRGLPSAVKNNLNLWLGKQPDYNSAAVYAGTASIAADCYLGSAVINDGIAGTGSTAYKNYWTSLAPKRGAWCFNWCSSGNQMVGNVILRGGAAGIGPNKEPFTGGLPEDGSVMALALQGYSLAEINWLMQPASNYAMTAWGDPLYRPFPALGLTDGEFLTITNNTKTRTASQQTKQRSVSRQSRNRTATNITPIRGATWRN